MAKDWIPKKNSSKRFTIKEKTQCVKLVQLHGSISKVSRMTGVTRPTLSKWMEEPELKPKYEVKPELIERRVARKIENEEVDFLAEVYGVKTKALKKMQDLINTSKSLKDVTNAFAILHQVGVGKDPTDGNDIKSMSFTQNTFITKIRELREKSENDNPRKIYVQPNESNHESE